MKSNYIMTSLDIFAIFSICNLRGFAWYNLEYTKKMLTYKFKVLKAKELVIIFYVGITINF